MANSLDTATMESSSFVAPAKSSSSRAAPAMHNGNMINRYDALALDMSRYSLVAHTDAKKQNPLHTDCNPSSWPS
jgi:hypothetical protein